ncbi:uncharacterized protein [Diadema antillarum]|uniref:uncharacterized protein n=1 Tax=Diadema antillarum TaxID=105358 RepID=UPI003A85F8D5
MSQAVGRMYHPPSPLRRAGEIQHIHPAAAHHYPSNYNAVQVYTVTTRNSSPPHHRPYHNGRGYSGPPPSPPHHTPRGGRRGRYSPNSYYNTPQQPYHHPHHPQHQSLYHSSQHHPQQQQQQRQQQHPPLQRQSSSPPYHHHNGHNGHTYQQNQNQNQSRYHHQRPRSLGFYDDLEWDNYDLSDDKEKKEQRKRNVGRDGWRKGGNGLTANESELEWDDYDLRPKIEETEDGLELVLPENYLPLLKASNKATLSRGHIPISAIQVRRLPHISFLSAKTIGFNKDLLVLTTELQGLGDSPNETNELLEDALGVDDQELLIAQNNNGPEALKSGSSSDIPGRLEGESVTDSDSIRDRSQELTDSDEQTTNDFLDDDYELPCHDRLADVDLYALSPHDFDSPDSIFSRSLADLTDLSLYEEFGVETIRRRRALLSADKEGRENLLKEATRKLSLKNKKRKRRTSDKVGIDGSIIGLGGVDEAGDGGKQKRVAPNYFVAIQVCNPEIHKALHDVQQTVMAGDEKLKDAMVPIPTLHLTIMVMHLATDEEVDRAKLALMECHQLLSPRFENKKLSIWFHGLGHFNNQVMFAKIKDVDGILDTLYTVAETVENCYRRHGIHSTGERGFKPHLTVMKLSRAPSLRKKGVRRIKSELYRTHSAQVFGSQPVTGFQLCSINKPKSEDGYYFKAHEVIFGQAPSPLPNPSNMQTKAESSSAPITESVTSPSEQAGDGTANQMQGSPSSSSPDQSSPNTPKEPNAPPPEIHITKPSSQSETSIAQEAKEKVSVQEQEVPPSSTSSPAANTDGNKLSESEPT